MLVIWNWSSSAFKNYLFFLLKIRQLCLVSATQNPVSKIDSDNNRDRRVQDVIKRCAVNGKFLKSIELVAKTTLKTITCIGHSVSSKRLSNWYIRAFCTVMLRAGKYSRCSWIGGRTVAGCTCSRIECYRTNATNLESWVFTGRTFEWTTTVPGSQTLWRFLLFCAVFQSRSFFPSEKQRTREARNTINRRSFENDFPIFALSVLTGPSGFTRTIPPFIGADGKGGGGRQARTVKFTRRVFSAAESRVHAAIWHTRILLFRSCGETQ